MSIKYLPIVIFIISLWTPARTDPFSYTKDDLYQPMNFMESQKVAHDKDDPEDAGTGPPWTPYDFDKFESYVDAFRDIGGVADAPAQNRVKRRSKKRRSHRRHGNTKAPEYLEVHIPPTSPPMRSGSKINRKWDKFMEKTPTNADRYREVPKDLYQAHLRPGVIFRIHMSEAILKMQYRNYVDDKDASVIEADVEYLRLTRKVVSDEVTKFEDLRWLVEWFSNRSDLVQEHVCNNKYLVAGIPPTAFTHPEEYMKRMCLFDGVYLDHVPYVVGEDRSLVAAVAPPVLHCDAATCTSVPFVDSLMFSETYPLSDTRPTTKCRRECHMLCRRDVDCFDKCVRFCTRSGVLTGTNK